MASLQARIASLITAIGADIKAINTALTKLGPNSNSFSAYNSTTQAAPPALNQWVRVSYPTEENDSGNAYDPTTSRFSPTVAGWYRIDAGIYYVSPAQAALALQKNGAPERRLGDTQGTAQYGLWGSALVYMNGTTDYLEVYHIITAGTLRATSPGPSLVYFQGELVSTPGAVTLNTTSPLVNALPSSPIDGQECYFLADATLGVVWHLRYRTASSSAYKWEVVSAVPLSAFTSGNLALGNSVWTSDPSNFITAPLAGEYELQADANEYFTSGTGVHNIQILVNGVSVTFGTSQSTNAGFTTTLFCAIDRVAVAKNQVVQTQYNVPGTGGVARYRNLKMTPLRVG